MTPQISKQHDTHYVLTEFTFRTVKKGGLNSLKFSIESIGLSVNLSITCFFYIYSHFSEHFPPAAERFANF